MSESKTRGHARSSGTPYADVIATDRVAAPDILSVAAYDWIDADEIPIGRYTSQEFHDIEAAKLWPATWQMACRLEHIPRPGDFVVYEICDISLVVIRGEDDQVRAFHNSCLHRGTALAEGQGSTPVLKCPFHGFTWNLDGTFKGMPAAWDFPHVDRDSFCLP